MNQKPHALAGMAAPLLFAVTYLLVAAARSDFNHFTKAVSELGSAGAPNAGVWNLFGCIIPGLLIAYFAIGLHHAITGSKQGQIAFFSLFFSGIFLALSGVFPGDYKNPAAPTMILHTVGTIGSFGAFLIAAFTYPLFLRKSAFWEKTILPSLTLTWLCILSGFLRTGAAPGIGQRAGFCLYFLWIAFMAVSLLRYQRLS